MEKVGALAAGGQGAERGFEGGVGGELGLEFCGDGEFGDFFEGDFQAGIFDFDGIADVAFEDGFEGGDLLNVGEADDAGGLSVFAGFDEDATGVFEEGAFDEADHAVVLEGAEDNNVGVLEGVNGVAPFEVFGEGGAQNDGSEFLEFGLPAVVFADVAVDLGRGIGHLIWLQRGARLTTITS